MFKNIYNVEEEIKRMGEFFNKLKQDKKASNEFFYKTGFYTKNGKLKKKFQ